jgi:hypothetical protein
MTPPVRRAVRDGPTVREIVRIDRAAAGARPEGKLSEQDTLRQEIESLRAEVKELRKSVEMLLSAVMDTEPPRAQAPSSGSEENPPFYN